VTLSVCDQVCALAEPAANIAACDMSWADCMLVKTTGSAVSTVDLTTFPTFFASTQSADYTPSVAAVVSLYSQLRKAEFNGAQDISGPCQHRSQNLNYWLLQAPSSDGQAAQQAPTSFKGKAAVKKNAANPSQEPAATTAAAAQDQADAEAPESSAKAAVAEAVDGATAPRCSKSAAEKQKRRADQAGTSGKAAAPAQAKTATPSAQVERDEKKKKSKKSKADQVDLV